MFIEHITKKRGVARESGMEYGSRLLCFSDKVR
jgi:hypothetical protein